MRVFLAVFIIGVLPAQAQAQAQAQCEEPYTAQNMVVDMQSAQMALSIDNPEGFTDAGVHLERGLPCLKEKVAPRGLAAAYRIISLTAFRKGDEPRSRRWARTARELDPDFGWGMVELEGSDPYRGVFESERENGGASAVPVEGMRLLLPEGGELMLDGHLLKAAEATTERYHLLQHFSETDGHQQTWIINGNGIPAEFLEEGSVESTDDSAAAKKKSRGQVAEDAPYAADDITVVDRVAPKGKKVFVATGLVGALAAGGAYAGSYFTRRSFDGATNSDDLTRYRRLTNGLVVASGGLLVVGIGVGWWGIALEDGAVLGRTWEF